MATINKITTQSNNINVESQTEIPTYNKSNSNIQSSILKENNNFIQQSFGNVENKNDNENNNNNKTTLDELDSHNQTNRLKPNCDSGNGNDDGETKITSRNKHDGNFKTTLSTTIGSNNNSALQIVNPLAKVFSDIFPTPEELNPTKFQERHNNNKNNGYHQMLYNPYDGIMSDENNLMGLNKKTLINENSKIPKALQENNKKVYTNFAWKTRFDDSTFINDDTQELNINEKPSILHGKLNMMHEKPYAIHEKQRILHEKSGILHEKPSSKQNIKIDNHHNNKVNKAQIEYNNKINYDEYTKQMDISVIKNLGNRLYDFEPVASNIEYNEKQNNEKPRQKSSIINTKRYPPEKNESIYKTEDSFIYKNQKKNLKKDVINDSNQSKNYSMQNNSDISFNLSNKNIKERLSTISSAYASSHQNPRLSIKHSKDKNLHSDNKLKSPFVNHHHHRRNSLPKNTLINEKDSRSLSTTPNLLPSIPRINGVIHYESHLLTNQSEDSLNTSKNNISNKLRFNKQCDRAHSSFSLHEQVNNEKKSQKIQNNIDQSSKNTTFNHNNNSNKSSSFLNHYESINEDSIKHLQAQCPDVNIKDLAEKVQKKKFFVPSLHLKDIQSTLQSKAPKFGTSSKRDPFEPLVESPGPIYNINMSNRETTSKNGTIPRSKRLYDHNNLMQKIAMPSPQDYHIKRDFDDYNKLNASDIVISKSTIRNPSCMWGYQYGSKMKESWEQYIKNLKEKKKIETPSVPYYQKDRSLDKWQGGTYISKTGRKYSDPNHFPGPGKYNIEIKKEDQSVIFGKSRQILDVMNYSRISNQIQRDIMKNIECAKFNSQKN